MKYDLSKIFPEEFECLINDLLAATWDVHIENFKSGKDKGIDGRYIDCGGNFHLIQSKHYAQSGFSALKTKIKNVELEKIKKLKPDKYYLGTSIKFSPEQKKELLTLCNGFIKNESDIYGADDINAMLVRNPDIVKHYYHLWLPQSPILEKILRSIQNKDIHNTTYDVINSSRDQANYYHRTSDYNKAYNILEKNKILLIHGVAGVGKTSLAHQLFLEYITNNFEPIAALNDVSEFYRVYEPAEKQIFFLDDCWGSNFASALAEKKDAHIVKFMRRIQSDQNKRLILTSRTNIQDDVFSRANAIYSKELKSKEYSIILQKFSLEEKASVLYYFLWRSEINIDFLEIIVNERLYDTIIRHQNYNPRLLEFITKIDMITANTPSEYKQYIFECLNNPKLVFKHPYEMELTELGRVILDLVGLCGGTIHENVLELAFEKWKLNNKFKPHDYPTGFRDVIQGMLRSFITRTIDTSGSVKYNVFNPSISDMIIERYFEEKRKTEYINYLNCFESSHALLFLARISDKYNHFSYDIIMIYLTENVNKILSQKIMIDGFIHCIKVLRFEDKLKIMTKDNFELFENMPDFGKEGLDIDELIGVYIDFSYFYNSSSSKKIIFFINALENFNFAHELLYALKKISVFLSDSETLDDFKQYENYDAFIKKLHEALLLHWELNIHEFAEDNVSECVEEISRNYCVNDDYDEPEFDFNEEKFIQLMLEDCKDLLVNIDIEDAKKIVYRIDWIDYMKPNDDEIYSEHREVNITQNKNNYNEDIFTNIIENKYK